MDEEVKKRISPLWFVIPLGILVLGFLCYVPFWINSAYLKGGDYQTVWNGSEFLAFYGTLLSAFGALFLGALSIWQNKQIQKSNEAAQERLERINTRANEISAINKIIEHEENRIQALTLSCSNYEEFCDTAKIADAFSSVPPTEFSSVSNKLRKENEKYFNSVFMYLSWQTVRDIELKRKAAELRTAVDATVTESDFEKRAYKALEMLDALWRFQDAKKDYLIDYQNKLEDIIFKDYSLPEIRIMYERQEEEENGQDEDAE